MSKLSKRTESIFEIVAGYFVDIHFNTLYVFAKNKVNSSGGSLTDEYRKMLNCYLMGTFGERDKYVHTVKELHKYYTEIINNSMVTFTDMVDTIVREIIPAEYINDLNSHQKDMILNDVIKRLVTWLGKKCAKDFIEYVIDSRNNVRIIQDAARDCLMTIRDDYYIKFAAQHQEKIVGNKNMVSMEIVEKLKAKLVEQVKLKCRAEQDRDKLNNMAIELNKLLKEAKNEIRKLRAEVKKLSAQANSAKPSSAASVNSATLTNSVTSTNSVASTNSAAPTNSLLPISQATQKATDKSETTYDLSTSFGNYSENSSTINILGDVGANDEEESIIGFTENDNSVDDANDNYDEETDDEEDELAQQKKLIESLRLKNTSKCAK